MSTWGSLRKKLTPKGERGTPDKSRKPRPNSRRKRRNRHWVKTNADAAGVYVGEFTPEGEG